MPHSDGVFPRRPDPNPSPSPNGTGGRRRGRAHGGALSVLVLSGSPHTPHPDCRYAWVFGGIDVNNGALNDLWMLDLQTNTWSERNADGATPAARRGASFVVLSQKSAYLFGGESASRVRRRQLQEP